MHGLLVASEAGFDHVFDMPNTNPAVTSREAVEKRLALGQEAEAKLATMGHTICYHLYCGITADTKQIQEMVHAYNDLFPRVCALKLFASQSTGNMGIIGKENQMAIYKTLAQLSYEGVLAVHCEKEELFDKSATCHSLVRPAISEEMSVRDQIDCAEKAGFKGNLHIAHVSTQGALKAIKEAKERGLIRITCGATPHHILLNRQNESMLAKMNPPLREECDRKAIFEGLFNGEVDWIESDHAPHTLQDKQAGASGIPGFEGMLLTIRELRKNGMDENRLNGLLGQNALKAFGIQENTTAVPQVSDDMIKAAHDAYPFSAWN